MRYEIRPLGPWPDKPTDDRLPSYRFRAPWDDTRLMLGQEVEKLGGQLVVIQVDVTEGEIRRDGMLRANAKVNFPGVRVSFESDHGPLTYATDRYDTWRANVRAIVLTLEHLRALDRWGVTKRGEQYVGWRAIASGPEKMTADAAAAYIANWAGTAWRGLEAEIIADASVRRAAYVAAQKVLHPDKGGNHDQAAQLGEARRILDAAAGTGEAK